MKQASEHLIISDVPHLLYLPLRIKWLLRHFSFCAQNRSRTC